MGISRDAGVPWSSPWGAVEQVWRYSAGLNRVVTSSGGGIHVASSLVGSFWAMQRPGDLDLIARTIGAAIPADDGGLWFEEDCAASFVVRSFPAVFSAEQVEEANGMLGWLDRQAISTSVGKDTAGAPIVVEVSS